MLRPLSELITPQVRQALTRPVDHQAEQRDLATRVNRIKDPTWTYPKDTSK